MATVILVRHGRSTANTAGTLAGRMGGVPLDDLGVQQADRVGDRLSGLPLTGLVTSPLERCRQTARRIADVRDGGPRPVTDHGLVECDYGDWTGRPLKELAKEKLWAQVQQQPSAAAFPGGESLAAMSARVLAAVRRRDAAAEAEHGTDALWVAVSHGDLIKAVLADALGLHLDGFQRLVVDPASVSIVRYTASRPYVLGTNTHAGDLGWLAPPKRTSRRKRGRRSTDAVVGGGAGPGESE